MAVIKLSKDDNTNGGSTYDEFSSHQDIEEAELDSDDLIIEELSGDSRTRIRERDSDEHYIKLNPQSEYVQKYFDDDEIEELSEKDRIVNGSPDEPEDIDEVWDGMREDIEAHNREVAKKKMAEEKAEAREFFKKGTKLDKEISEMTGSEFAELMANANEGETGIEAEDIPEYKETIKNIEEKYSKILGKNEPDIKDPNDAVENLSEATDAFREYDNAVFDELAQDIEDSDGLTEYTTLSENNSRRVRTKDPELRDAIVNHENEPFDGDVTIHERGSEYVEATITKND
ncbi:hypothetical protein RH858_07190 [Halalkaliarchaeum sp. AArc-GB]|uniref:hypothetical protein n=1 Tax=Halalkaliarchaeum sp. AArc-GB TaxID=3074078 RepID=UPI0028584D86|nr:hypothetical protein [Halalkaliarchaeum sp. AArc-GB]MDR5672933.1 hypothetical protein [Halalkaliarchaeum sp. AArc-GB]